MDWKTEIQGMRGQREPEPIGKPALLVIDMQKYFCDSKAPAYDSRFEAIIPQIQSLIDEFERHGFPVFASRYYSSSQNDPIVRWWGSELHKESQWFDIDSRLNLGEAMVLDKDLYGTFSSTDIDSELREKGCDTVVICGVMTDLCCETTAREAFQNNYNVIFSADGTATSSDKLQMGALATLAHGFAYIMDIDDILTLLEGM